MQTKVERICEFCGKPFYSLPKDIKRGRGKYCSHGCHYSDIQRRVKCVCKTCGKPFSVSVSRYENNRGKYCSKNCQTSSPEWKSLISENHADVGGKNHWFYGKHFSEDHKKKISAANKGKRLSAGQILLLSEVNKGNRNHAGKRHSLEVRAKISNGRRGKRPSAETRIKLSESHKGLLVGPKNPHWRGGISFEPYCPKFTKALKEYIRAKFGHRCVIGGNCECARELSVHHVDYNKLQGCKGHTWALIPMCAAHHTKTNFNRWFWFSKLINYWAAIPDINLMGLPFCDLTLEVTYSGIGLKETI